MDDYYRQDWDEQERYIASYASFIGEMQTRADRMMNTAIFADPGSYVDRNLLKSCGDFAPLSQIALSADNCFGIHKRINQTQWNCICACGKIALLSKSTNI